MGEAAKRSVALIVDRDLVVNTAKYLAEQPILALNPDSQRVDGILIRFAVEEAGEWVARHGRAPLRAVTMAKASLKDGQVLYAFNDLFVGPRSHVSAGYRIEYAGQADRRSQFERADRLDWRGQHGLAAIHRHGRGDDDWVAERKAQLM